ncbi:MAG: flagellar protein FliT [Burkholderiales bacterium]|jgi:flagellar protein FliT|nr:flagellar protein FliT [Burkholderiales bacterium]
MPDDGRLSGTRAPGQSLIAHYESIARASHAMLAAARAEDWARVGEIERECRALIAQLQAAAQSLSLSEDEQRRRVQLLRFILADDAEVRARSEPWLLELEQMFDAGRRHDR